MLNSCPYPYTLTRSRRKTVCISITSSGQVAVKAPIRMANQEIDVFVEKHRSWIDKHRQFVVEKAKRAAAFTWADGDLVPVLGEACPLRTASVGERGVKLVQSCLEIGSDMKNRQAAVTGFLREMARRILSERTAHFAAIMGVHPTGLKITGARTRWGSCSGKNSLCFSYRLICLPMAAVDAVVVHELAHILVKNHSPAFYAQVTRILPDYESRRTLLRQLNDGIPF